VAKARGLLAPSTRGAAMVRGATPLRNRNVGDMVLARAEELRGAPHLQGVDDEVLFNAAYKTLGLPPEKMTRVVAGLERPVSGRAAAERGSEVAKAFRGPSTPEGASTIETLQRDLGRMRPKEAQGLRTGLLGSMGEEPLMAFRPSVRAQTASRASQVDRARLLESIDARAKDEAAKRWSMLQQFRRPLTMYGATNLANSDF
jgi:hypothetical protein